MLTKAFHLTRFYFRKCLNRLLLFLDQWLVSIYCSPSRLARLLLTRPTYEFRRLLVLLQRGLSFKVFVLKGTAAETKTPFSVAYFADGDSMNYLVSLLFAGGQAEGEERGICSLWTLAKTSRALAREVDLVVIERNSLLKWRPPFGSWVVGPTWVRMVFDFIAGQTWEQIEYSFKRHDQNIRRFKKAGYTYRISNRDEDFEYFYDRMHVPLIDARHKGYGIIGTKQELYRYFEKGHIIFALNRENQPVAGALNCMRGDVFLGLSNGVLDGDRKWMQEGALSVLYYYSIQWCLENGVRSFDVGTTRPFAYEGVYNHKRRWGFHPIQELWEFQQWLFWAPDDSPAALKWMETHPFIPEFAHLGSKSLESVYQQIPSFQSSPD